VIGLETYKQGADVSSFMDVNTKPVNQSAEATPRRSVLKYIGELKEELKKVTWTTKAELKLCTKLVVGSTFVLGLGIYLVDLMIKGVLDAFSALVRVIFG
jgi:preprotein translocase subunit SecE